MDMAFSADGTPEWKRPSRKEKRQDNQCLGVELVGRGLSNCCLNAAARGVFHFSSSWLAPKVAPACAW